MSGPARLAAAVRQDIDRSVLCWLATVAADGTPNVSPKEVFCAQGEDALLIADIASPGSVANIRVHPRVCVSFIDIFRQKGWKVVGTATLIGADDPDFAAIARPLTVRAGPSFPVRHAIRVAPERIARILAPSWTIFPDRGEEERMAEIYRLYGVRPLGAEG